MPIKVVFPYKVYPDVHYECPPPLEKKDEKSMMAADAYGCVRHGVGNSGGICSCRILFNYEGPLTRKINIVSKGDIELYMRG